MQVRAPEDGVRSTYGSLRLTVRRDNIFADSFFQLRVKTAEEMRLKLNITFQGEEGIDAGGVTREWYQVRGPGAARAGGRGGRVRVRMHALRMPCIGMSARAPEVGAQRGPGSERTSVRGHVCACV
jgi:hypothetical protein